MSESPIYLTLDEKWISNAVVLMEEAADRLRDEGYVDLADRINLLIDGEEDE